MKRIVEEELRALAMLFSTQTPLYLVGGRVRDCIVRDMDISATDADICSAIAYADFVRLVQRAGLQIESGSEKLGTAWVKGKEGRYEYATFRKDSYPASKGDHLPDKVEFVYDLEQDCLRRDFRCNALYYDIVADKVIDPLDGKKDIDDEILSTVRESDLVFCEDGLRILRLFRFCSTLGFGIEQATLQSAIRHASNLNDIKAERIAVEIKKLLSGDNAEQALKGAFRSGAMKYVLQRVDENIQIEGDEELSVGIDDTPKRLRIVTMIANIAKQIQRRGKPTETTPREGESAIDSSDMITSAEQLATKWKETYPQSMEKGLKLTTLTRGVATCECASNENEVKRVTVEYAGEIEDIVIVLNAMGKGGDERAKIAYGRLAAWLKKVREKEIPLSVASLAVSGDDMKALGYSGAEIRSVLEKLRDLCVSEEIVGTREVLLSKAKEWSERWIS